MKPGGITGICLRKKIAVLFDDLAARAGEKLSDSDLLGIPARLTISKRTFQEGKIELRVHRKSELVTYDGALKAIVTFF